MSFETSIQLKCHPCGHAGPVRSIEAAVHRPADTELQITFRLDGTIGEILIPSPAAPRFNTQLWQHTCFELFVAVGEPAAYHEFNCAPSGEWAVYSFRGYRDGSPVIEDRLRPTITLRLGAERLELETVVRLDAIAAVQPRAAMRIGLSAVIESAGGLSYWAIHHPIDKPDFHHPDSFALLVEGPSQIS